MTARSRDWHLTGVDSDPVPAARSDVATVARRARRRADDAEEIRETLNALADLDGWRGEAAEAFADKADEVLGDLGKVVDRYNALGAALEGWADDVDTYRTRTATIVTDAENADQAIRDNPVSQPVPGGEDLTPEQEQRNQRNEDATTDLGAARTAMTQAVQDFADAAKQAKGKIEDAAGIWDDGWWGNVKGWIRDNADLIDAIVTVLQVVAAIVGVILLVVAVVFTAPFWLVAAAVALTVAVLVGTVLLVVADTGKKTWGDVAWALADVALAVVGGRAATAAARGLSGLVPRVAARVGAQTRIRSLHTLVAGRINAFKGATAIRNPANGLSQWANRLRGTAAADGAAASQRILNLADVAPTRLSSVLHQDRSLAQLNNTLRNLRSAAPLTPAETRLADDVARNIRNALIANSAATGSSAVGMPGTVTDAVELVRNPPWTARGAS